MVRRNKKQFPGICPECHAGGLEYPHGDRNTDCYRIYPCRCPACGWEGQENHVVEFEEFETRQHGDKLRRKKCKKKS